MRLCQVGALVAISIVVSSPDAQAISFWPFSSRIQELTEKARSAREEGKFHVAASYLEEASSYAEGQDPRILFERGLLARDRRQEEKAIKLLGEAADLAGESSARLEQSAVLVSLGRWPEAVVVLRQAFEERRNNLPVEDITRDPRFAPLGEFAPFRELIQIVEEEQAGLLGRLFLKLERLESSAQSIKAVADKTFELGSFIGRVLELVGFGVVFLVLMGCVFAFAVTQLGMFKPPWTFFTGMLVASLLWHFAVRTLTAGGSYGLSVILPAWGWVVAPWAAVGAYRGTKLWLRRRRDAQRDPLRAENLETTVTVLRQAYEEAEALLECETDRQRKDQTIKARSASRSAKEQLGFLR